MCRELFQARRKSNFLSRLRLNDERRYVSSAHFDDASCLIGFRLTFIKILFFSWTQHSSRRDMQCEESHILSVLSRKCNDKHAVSKRIEFVLHFLFSVHEIERKSGSSTQSYSEILACSAWWWNKCTSREFSSLRTSQLVGGEKRMKWKFPVEVKRKQLFSVFDESEKKGNPREDWRNGFDEWTEFTCLVECEKKVKLLIKVSWR